MSVLLNNFVNKRFVPVASRCQYSVATFVNATQQNIVLYSNFVFLLNLFRFFLEFILMELR